MPDDARQEPQQASPSSGEGAKETIARSLSPQAAGFHSGSSRRKIVTPQGTMVVVLIYAVGTVLLWSYVYYYTLRFGGVIGGH